MEKFNGFRTIQLNKIQTNMVKITLLAASIATIATAVMAQVDNATPTPAPTAVAKRDEYDDMFSSYFNDPEGIQKHLSRASERLNHLPSEARASAQSRIAEASRSIGAIRPTDRDGNKKTPTASATSPDVAPAPSATAGVVAADKPPSAGNKVNMPLSAVGAAIAAAIAVGALV
ncbi:unnamed protein product [Mucor hiemalis]